MQALREAMESFEKIATVSNRIGVAQKEAAEFASIQAKEAAKNATEEAATAVKACAAPGAAAGWPFARMRVFVGGIIESFFSNPKVQESDA